MIHRKARYKGGMFPPKLSITVEVLIAELKKFNPKAYVHVVNGPRGDYGQPERVVAHNGLDYTVLID